MELCTSKFLGAWFLESDGRIGFSGTYLVTLINAWLMSLFYKFHDKRAAEELYGEVCMRSI